MKVSRSHDKASSAYGLGRGLTLVAIADVSFNAALLSSNVNTIRPTIGLRATKASRPQIIAVRDNLAQHLR